MLLCCQKYRPQHIDPCASIWEFSTKFQQTLPANGEWSQQSVYIAGYFIVSLINCFSIYMWI